jgi:peptidoglycan/LPS O-acetylase OafA/YrhL
LHERVSTLPLSAPEPAATPPTPADRIAAASARGERFRADIQALRGLAVTLVVLYHAGLPGVPQGYLGVDIFFTISGFLITGIVVRGLEASTFRFAEFYARRARRLLPAAWVMLAVTTLLAAWLLTATRYVEYRAQLTGASVFAANIVSWQQTGYFATDAAFSPLLHMWSLAVEEQYYLLMPLALWLLPRRWRLAGVALGTAASLALCLYLVERRPSVAFFFLPTRAWELGIGSVGALVAGDPRVRRWAGGLLVPALGLVLAVPLLPLAGPHPGWNALAVCLGTLGVLLAGSAALARNAAVRGLARVGDLSYSLYLVHWPLLSLARVAHLTKALPPAVAAGLVLASLLLAWAMFRFVEEPCRRAAIGGWRLAAACVLAFAMLIGLAAALGPAPATVAAARAALAPVEGLPPAICRKDLPRYNGECRQRGPGHVLLWGDSYAMHLVPGLLATSDGALDQASLGHCSPLVDYAAVPSANERAFSETCMGFTRSVLDYIRRTPAIRTVILSASYSRTLASAGGGAVARVGGVVRDAPLGLAPTLAAQRRTVAAIRALGRRVVVVAPTPPSPIDLGQCWERRWEGRPILGLHRDCRNRRAAAPDLWQEQDALLAGFVRSADVPVIRLDRALCQGDACPTRTADAPLFRDGGHLSRAGSLFAGRRLELGRLADRVAR